MEKYLNPGNFIILATVLAIIFVIVVSILSRNKKGGNRHVSASPVDLGDNEMSAFLEFADEAMAITNHSLAIISCNNKFRELLSASIILNEQPLSDILRAVNTSGELVGLSTLLEFKTGDKVSHDNLYISDQSNKKLEIKIEVHRIPSKLFSDSIFIWKISNISNKKAFTTEQSDITSVISHELRTPVTVIEASISSMLANTREILTPTQIKLATAAKENVLFLSRLLSDLSVYSKLQSGEVDSLVNDISPRSIIEQIQRVFNSQAQSKKLVLITDHDPSVRSVISSEAHILSILQNLVKNAIQFTDLGGIITLSSKSVSDGVIFSVRDTGIGISSERKQKLFENTFHANTDTMHEKMDGPGLGLFISHRLATAIKADLWVESEEGNGATFFLKIPYSSFAKKIENKVLGPKISRFSFKK